jgi:hypothetical protein
MRGTQVWRGQAPHPWEKGMGVGVQVQTMVPRLPRSLLHVAIRRRDTVTCQSKMRSLAF